ncbi:MAG: Uncharacterized protein G01um1014107_335 [Parcubacteria group bacterium Gr01-1014_107]|nr:MAG: Uncharacterized protein G01um1014107_335 [Parcubacteria group bacterium Gr01-1014_107]
MKSPEGFLPEKYPDLPGSRPVERAVEKVKKEITPEEKKEGKHAPHTKAERVEAYLDRIEQIISSGTKVNDERGWELLKNKITKEFSIDADDPDILEKIAHGLYESEKKLAIEQGRQADVERLEQELEQEGGIMKRYLGLVREKRDIQERTLASWLDYLKQNDAQYPKWFQYFAVRNLQKMGTLDKERGEYSKRTPHTVAPFPELNSEALGFVYRMLVEGPQKEEFEGKANQEKREKLEELISKKDFPKLYTFAQLETAGQLNRESIEGHWVKYEQGSDHHLLENALRGKGTGWCTAEGSARAHLQGGDFYVYYSQGPSGEFSEPRVAVRLENNQVAEVRGVNHRQELEPALVDIAQAQYRSLPGGEKFEKKSADMKRMTELVRKQETGEPFTKKDLLFLYEFDSPIEGFGYEKDPRIEEVKEGRNFKEDLSFALDIPQEKISTDQKEALKGGIVYHYGDLDLGRLTSAEGLILPKKVGGSLNLPYLTSAEGLKLPEHLGGDLFLSRLTSAEGLKLPERIGGNLDLHNLTSAKGLKLPEHIGGILDLRNLTSAKGLKLPEHISGNLYLDNLTSAEKDKLRKQYPNLKIV